MNYISSFGPSEILSRGSLASPMGVLLALVFIMSNSIMIAKLLFVLGFVSLLATGELRAQTGGQDSSQAGTLRPRRGTYEIQSYPSPAKSGEQITVQFFCINEDVVSFEVFDMLCKPVLTLQDKQTTSAGLHTFLIAANLLSTGTYFARLTSYTPSGAENTVEDTRIVITK